MKIFTETMKQVAIDCMWKIASTDGVCDEDAIRALSDVIDVATSLRREVERRQDAV